MEAWPVPSQVEHPIYHNTTDIYGSNVNTYVEAGQFPDLDVRYSILCQAALAAPLLLWAGSIINAAAKDPAGAAGVTTAESASHGEAQQESAGLVFVGNDWPCAPLALRLSLYRQSAQQQQPGMPAPGAGDSAADAQVDTPLTPSSPPLAEAAATHVPMQGEASQLSGSRAAEADGSLRNGAAAAGQALPVAGVSPVEGALCSAEEDGQFAARLQGSLQGAASVFCIHNLAYQGCCAAETFPRLCLPDAALPSLLWPPPPPPAAAPAGEAPLLLPVLAEGADHRWISTGALRLHAAALT